ncbi:MAG: thioredoxin [Thiotrichaceae bacterium]
MATVELNKENFENTISSNNLVLVDFWAAWCGPCRNFAPVYERASEKHTDVVFGKVNTEEQRELAQTFQIRSIPTLMIFREQIIIFSQAGSLPEQALTEVIEKAKNLDMDLVRAEIAKQQDEAVS